MGNRLFWILLLGIAFTLLILIGRHDNGRVVGLSTYDFASIGYYLILLVFVGSGMFILFRRQLAQAFKSALIWAVIALGLVVAYTYRGDFRDVYQRVMAELLPGRPANRAMRIVEISRGRTGDFQVSTQVNGSTIPMVLDTGASAVVLTQDAAKAAGLPLEVLVYDVNVDTANGRTKAASVTLDRVAIGNIVERSVPALVAQAGQLRASLLGMSFLNRLESWEVRGDKVVMRGYP